MTMKIWLRLVYADGDVAATLLRPWRWSYAFAGLLYPFYMESEILICFYYDLGASTALYYALVVSATIRVILTELSNRNGIAVQWNGVFNFTPNFMAVLQPRLLPYPPPPPFHWTVIPLRSWRSRIFSIIIPNRCGSVDSHTIRGLTLPVRFYYASAALLL